MTALSIAAQAFGMLVLVALPGCLDDRASGDDVPGEVREAVVTIGSAGVVTVSSNTASEVSATVSPDPQSSTGGIVLVSGFNDSGPSLFGYGYSTTGASFTACNQGSPTSKCGAGNEYPGPSAQWSYASDPTMVADNQGNVVFVTLERSTSGLAAPDRVVATVSPDGGRSFNKRTIANDDPLCEPSLPEADYAACHQCLLGGANDQPDATFDLTTTPPTLWVVWRRAQILAGGITGFGACIRQGFLTGNGSKRRVVWTQHPFAVQGIDADILSQEAGLYVRAGFGVVSVAYEVLGNISSSYCAAPPALQHAYWGLTRSLAPQQPGVYWGRDWASQGLLAVTDSFSVCNMGNTVYTGRRSFSFAQSSLGTYFVALQDSASTIRLFKSTSQGAYWQQLVTGVDGGSAWVANDGSESPAAIVSQTQVAHPTLMTDGASRLGISYYEATTLGGTNMSLVFRGTSDPIATTSVWDQPLNAQAFQVTKKFQAPPNTQGRGLGDYQGGTTTTGNVVGCGLQGNFDPFFTEGLTGNAQISTAQLSF